MPSKRGKLFSYSNMQINILNYRLSFQFAPRPTGFQCPYANNIQSYCDAADPYCCNGNDANTHQGYGTEYGQAALTFVKAKINAALGNSGPTTSSPGSPPHTTTTAPGGGSTGGGSVPHWGQCGGQGWTGGTVCQAPYTCQAANPCKSGLVWVHNIADLGFFQTTPSACKRSRIVTSRRVPETIWLLLYIMKRAVCIVNPVGVGRATVARLSFTMLCAVYIPSFSLATPSSLGYPLAPLRLPLNTHRALLAQSSVS